MIQAGNISITSMFEVDASQVIQECITDAIPEAIIDDVRCTSVEEVPICIPANRRK